MNATDKTEQPVDDLEGLAMNPPRPTPLTLKEVQDKLRSTEEITPTEKKKIEEFFDDEKKQEVPLPPRRPYVPVVNRLRDNPELQKLKQSLRQNKSQGASSRNRKKTTK